MPMLMPSKKITEPFVTELFAYETVEIGAEQLRAIESLNRMQFVGEIEKVQHELFRFSTVSLKKKRMQKKFLKNLDRYVPREIFLAYLGRVCAEPIRRLLSYSGIARKIFPATPIES